LSADPSAASTPRAATDATGEFNRTAMTILATMVLLIVALTGVLVETTWRSSDGSVDGLPSVSDPGSFAQR
jgi:hypothetical protein